MNILKYAIFAVSGTALLTFASCSPDVEIKPLPFEVEMTWNGEQVPQNLVLNAVGSRFTNDYYWNRMELSFYNNYGDGYNNPASITTAQPEWMQFLPSNFGTDVASLIFEGYNININGSSEYGDRDRLMFAPNTTNAERKGTVKIDYKYLDNSKTFEVNFTQEPSAHVDEPVSLTMEKKLTDACLSVKILYPQDFSGQPISAFIVPLKARNEVDNENEIPLNPDARMIIARDYMLRDGFGQCFLTDYLPYVHDDNISFDYTMRGEFIQAEDGRVCAYFLYLFDHIYDFNEFVVYTMSFDNSGEPIGFSAKTFTVDITVK